MKIRKTPVAISSGKVFHCFPIHVKTESGFSWDAFVLSKDKERLRRLKGGLIVNVSADNVDEAVLDAVASQLATLFPEEVEEFSN
jgi:hypothetical protein